MNRIGEITLKGLRKVYQIVFHPKPLMLPCETDPDKASEIIYELLISEEPCMVARFGSTELNALSNYREILDNKRDYLRFIKRQCQQWWWNDLAIKQLETHSGFFPSNKETVIRFYQLMINDIPLVDVLASWRPEEVYFKEELQNAQKVKLLCLEPYWSMNPWSRALKDKKVLVVHPFAEDIKSQYNNRERLFENPEVLPKFGSLRIVKAVQSLGGDINGFEDWFEALDWMKQEMDREPYDIALIGCGAYGFPLAAHSKRTGHKAIHLGGALQLLFGIKGKRWENSNYCNLWQMKPWDFYLKMMSNPYWIRPNENVKPKSAENVEGACYW